MWKIVQTEVEEAGLGKKILETNQIKKKFDNPVEKIKKKIEKYINNNNVTWIRGVLLRLIYIEKKT